MSHRVIVCVFFNVARMGSRLGRGTAPPFWSSVSTEAAKRLAPPSPATPSDSLRQEISDRTTIEFLGAITNTSGPVKLATVFNPWLVNENEQPALVGGHPAVVYPADVQTAVESDPAFKALRNDFPQLLFWKPGPILETSTTTDTGQIFVFRYRLLDGCHACAIRGWARIQFAFAPDGTYRNDRLLSIERQ